MQIHELTRPRKVKEGFLNALANKAISSALGGADVTSTIGSTPQSREQGFQSMVNSPAAKTLATTMQSAWQQTVHNFLMNTKDANGNPATSLKGVTQPSVDALLPELRTLVNKMIGGRTPGFDYASMSNNVEDPVAKAGIQEVIARINEYIQAIYKATVQGVEPKALANDWIKLVGDGVLPAQNAMAYDRRSYNKNKTRLYTDPDGKRVIDLGYGPEWFDDNNPEHVRVRDEYLKGKAKT